MYELPDYFKATNLAYEVLLKADQFKLPILVLPLIKNTPNISVISYTQFAQKSKATFDEFLDGCPSNSGFTLKQGNRHIITINETLPIQVCRFTLAHEFAHCILEHSIDNLISQKEANCFARNLLCPLPVRSGLMLNSANDYVRAFNISQEMAAVTIKLNEQDRYHTEHRLANGVMHNFSKTLKFGGGN